MLLKKFKITFRRAAAPRSAVRKNTYTAAKKRDRRTLVTLIVILMASLVVVTVLRLRPVMRQMAAYVVNDEVTRLVNKAIRDKISDGSLKYDDLITLEKNDDGTVTALKTNMAEINVLQTELTNCIIERLSETLTTRVEIPMGNIIGGALLSGHGPHIPVKVVSITNVTPRFSNEFSSAGINQTRHRIILDITVDIEMLIPGDSVTDTVHIQMVTAETIIVGTVPEAYADLNGYIN